MIMGRISEESGVEKIVKTEEIFEYVQKQYGTVPEYLWSKSPDSVVLRHKNGKWYAVFMTVEKSKLGLEGNDLVAIMDVKCDPGATQALTRARERCFVCSDSEIMHYYRFSSVFGLWHKANSAAKSSNFPPIFQKQKF